MLKSAKMPSTTADNSTRPPCCVRGDGGISSDKVVGGGDDGGDDHVLDSWFPSRTQPRNTTTTTIMAKTPQSCLHRPIIRSQTPTTNSRHHRPIAMQQSSSFPSSIDSFIAYRTNRDEEGGVVSNNDDDDDDSDSLAFRTRLHIADYPSRHHSSSSSSSKQLLRPLNHRPRWPCAIIASTAEDDSINDHAIAAPVGVKIGDFNQLVVPNIPTRERLNTTDTSATVPSYNTSSMLLKKNGMITNVHPHYMDNEATYCHGIGHKVTTPNHFPEDLKTFKMANRTLASSDIPETFHENYFDEVAMTKTTHTPPPPCHEGGTCRRKGSFYDDAASDVSSLTDAVSFHHEDGKKEVEKEMVADGLHQFADMRHRSFSTTVIAATPGTGGVAASQASPVRNASPSTTNPVSLMAAALLRKPRVLQRVRSLRSHSLEGFDHTLEQQLYMDGSKRGIVENIVRREQQDIQQQSHQHLPSHTSPRRPLVDRGASIYQSPLGEAIDREKISSSSRKLQSLSSSSQNSRSTSSSTTMTHQKRSRNVSRSGKPQISSSRRNHSPVPGDEGRAHASARRHRQTNSDDTRVTASRDIESLWVSTSPPPLLGARASTTTGLQNSWLTFSPNLPPLMGSEVKQRRRRHSDFPAEDTRPSTTGRLPLRSGEDLIDITVDEPVDPFSGLIGMPPSIVGRESDDVFGFPTISSSCSSGDVDNNSSIRSSSSPAPPGGESFLGKPPSGKRTPKRAIVVETFDPLLEGGRCGDGDGIKASSFSMLSPRRPSATPPRHYKDDPLLANSSYRPPMMMRSPTSSGQSHQTRPTLTLRSNSLGSGLNENPSVGSNTCILGTIAQLEVSTPRGLKDRTTAVRFNSSSRSLNGTVHSTFEAVSGVTEEKSSRTTQTTLLLDKSHDEQDYENDEDGSCRSFTEEFHRREQKHKVVAREVKQILGFGVVGKWFGRSSEGTKLKRAGGCLT